MRDMLVRICEKECEGDMRKMVRLCRKTYQKSLDKLNSDMNELAKNCINHYDADRE